MERERLQKVLAAAGLGSRRECEEIILEARVSVNGNKVSELPVLVDPEHDEIKVDGRPLRVDHKVYYLLHKPEGVHCTNYDPAGRPLVCDLLRGVRERVYPVGRLDAQDTGLLLMTNDGELAQRLTHPRYGVPKTYRCHVTGLISKEDIERLKRGIYITEGKAQISAGKVIHSGRDGSVVEVTLQEGKNREVRRVLARLGHKVKRLTRIKIGPLSLRGIAPTGYRPLTEVELKTLRKYAEAPPPPRLGRRPARPRAATDAAKPTPRNRRKDRQIDHRVRSETEQRRDTRRRPRP